MRIYRRGAAGIFWVQWRGQRQSLGTNDRKAAELAFAELQRRAADPTYATAHETTLDSCLADHIADRKRLQRADGTIEAIGYHAGHWCRVLGAEFPLALFTPRSADKYIAEREAEGAKPATIVKEISTMRGALRSAKRRGQWHGDPATVFPEYTAPLSELDRHLTLPQVFALLCVLPTHRRPHIAFMVAFAADWGSLWTAQPGDIGGASAVIRGTKTSTRHRVLPVLPQLAGLASLAASGVPFAPWSKGSARRDIMAACRRAGVPEVTARDLRRSHGKMLRAWGVHPQLIGRMMGHSDSRMVERVYGRLDHEDLGRLLQHSVTVGDPPG